MSDNDFTQTTDAMEWAKAFCERFNIYTDEGVESDPTGVMVGWFANAIERGRTAGEAAIPNGSAKIDGEWIRVVAVQDDLDPDGEDHYARQDWED